MFYCKGRGQAALEYMIIIATLLIVTAVMLAYTLPAYNNAIKIDQLKNAVNTLSLTAEKAYALGSGSVVINTITLPDGVESVLIVNNRLEIVVDGSTTMVVFDFNVSGSIPTKSGYHKIRAEAVDGNVVFSEVV